MSYTDVLDISYQERVYLIDEINKKFEESNKRIEQIKQQNLSNK